MATQQQESKYQQLHPDGFYTVKVLAQTLAESKEKHTPYLALKVEVLSLKKAKDGKPHTIKTGAHRFINLWLTANTIEKAKGFLTAAGFKKGMSLSQLNPNDPRHFSLVGYEFEASNKQEKIEKGDNAGKFRDKFDAWVSNKDPNAWMAKLGGPANSAKILQLDAIFGSAPDYAAQAPVKQTAAQTEKPATPDPTDEDFTW